MPCNSDHMKQNAQEAMLQHTSTLLRYLVDREAPGSSAVTLEQIVQATNYYAKDVGQVETLCAILRSFDADAMNTFVFDGRNPLARKLADWWERHQQADEIRSDNRKFAYFSFIDGKPTLWDVPAFDRSPLRVVYFADGSIGLLPSEKVEAIRLGNLLALEVLP